MKGSQRKKITISGSFYLLFFILSAARAILLSSSSELLNTKKIHIREPQNLHGVTDTKCSPSIKTLHWNIFFNCQGSYWLIPINLPLKKFFSCFRIQRELHLFIAAMIHTETVLCTIIQAKIFVHWLILTVNILWWRFSRGQTPNFYGPSSTDLFTFLSTSAMVKKQLCNNQK